MIENRVVGIKSREIYETPVAPVDPGSPGTGELTLAADVLRSKRQLEMQWADLVYQGLWFGPLKDAWTDSWTAPSSTSTALCLRSPGAPRSSAVQLERSLRAGDGVLRQKTFDLPPRIYVWGRQPVSGLHRSAHQADRRLPKPGSFGRRKWGNLITLFGHPTLCSQKEAEPDGQVALWLVQLLGKQLVALYQRFESLLEFSFEYLGKIF